MGFSKQEYSSGLPFSSPGDLPNPGIEPMSLMSPALAGKVFIVEQICSYVNSIHNFATDYKASLNKRKRRRWKKCALKN